jgi:hypothetical protein
MMVMAETQRRCLKTHLQKLKLMLFKDAENSTGYVFLRVTENSM